MRRSRLDREGPVLLSRHLESIGGRTGHSLMAMDFLTNALTRDLDSDQDLFFNLYSFGILKIIHPVTKDTHPEAKFS